eukprot:16439910-Heterocapsa_arctica.AAC.1
MDEDTPAVTAAKQEQAAVAAWAAQQRLEAQDAECRRVSLEQDIEKKEALHQSIKEAEAAGRAETKEALAKIHRQSLVAWEEQGAAGVQREDRRPAPAAETPVAPLATPKAHDPWE